MELYSIIYMQYVCQKICFFNTNINYIFQSSNDNKRFVNIDRIIHECFDSIELFLCNVCMLIAEIQYPHYFRIKNVHFTPDNNFNKK